MHEKYKTECLALLGIPKLHKQRLLLLRRAGKYYDFRVVVVVTVSFNRAVSDCVYYDLVCAGLCAAEPRRPVRPSIIN